MFDNEGNLHIGSAVAMSGNEVAVYMESFGGNVASAFLATGVGSYDLDLDSVQVIGEMVAIWDLKEPALENDPAFLEMAYPYRSEEATIVYYARENEKMNIYTEPVILEDCDENGLLTVDHFPENMLYPAHFFLDPCPEKLYHKGIWNVDICCEPTHWREGGRTPCTRIIQTYRPAIWDGSRPR